MKAIRAAALPAILFGTLAVALRPGALPLPTAPG